MTTEADALGYAYNAYLTVTAQPPSSVELSAILQVAYIESSYGDFWPEHGQPSVYNIGNLVANADWLAANPTSFIDWQTGLRIFTDGMTGLYTAKFRTYASVYVGWEDFVRTLLTWADWPNIRASSKPYRITPKSGAPNFTAEQLYYLYQYP